MQPLEFLGLHSYHYHQDRVLPLQDFHLQPRVCGLLTITSTVWPNVCKNPSKCLNSGTSSKLLQHTKHISDNHALPTLWSLVKALFYSSMTVPLCTTCEPMLYVCASHTTWKHSPMPTSVSAVQETSLPTFQTMIDERLNVPEEACHGLGAPGEPLPRELCFNVFLMYPEGTGH